MRISSLIFVGLAFFAAAGLSIVTAFFGARIIEETSTDAVRRSLAAEGLEWADVAADGLQVFVIGNAPDEVERFQALTVAGGTVDAARVIDQMTVLENSKVDIPEFSVNILRNDAGLSAIGIIPTGQDYDDLVARLNVMAGDQKFTDLLDSADYPAPATWTTSMRFALESLEKFEKAKISVADGEITISALAQTPTEKRQLERELLRQKPESIDLVLELTAPRPVISPYSLRAVKEGDTLKFDSCSAASEAMSADIVKSVDLLGLAGSKNCQVGLGMPTQTWPQATKTALASLSEFEKATVTFANTSIKLVADETTDPDFFQTTVDALKQSLPPGYELTAILTKPVVETDTSESEFVATLSPEGMVQLRGTVRDQTTSTMIQSLAEARFGRDAVHTSTTLEPALPTSWSVGVLTALEALSQLTQGAISVSPDTISVSGKTSLDTAKADIASLLAEKISTSQSVDISLEYVPPPVVEDNSLDPETCVAKISELLVERKINFEPGSDRVDLDGQNLLDDIAAVLETCGDIALEIAGHTDSQGREEMNKELSQSRAQAVLMELQRRRILTSSFVANGYGEAEPIADNGTAEGRETNRRIEFKLIQQQPEASDE